VKWLGSGGGKKEEKKVERWPDESSCVVVNRASACGEGWLDDSAEAGSRWGEWKAESWVEDG
jgi:hypothetical protein